MIAFDSSALVKLLIRETETAALRAWLAAQDPAPWVASDLCRVEVPRAASRAAPTAGSAARALLAGMDLVPLTSALLERASGLAPASLRSLDAVHLATAMGLGTALDSFVVYDDRLGRAATDAGLPVVAPV